MNHDYSAKDAGQRPIANWEIVLDAIAILIIVVNGELERDLGLFIAVDKEDIPNTLVSFDSHLVSDREGDPIALLSESNCAISCCLQDALLYREDLVICVGSIVKLGNTLAVRRKWVNRRVVVIRRSYFYINCEGFAVGQIQQLALVA
jgi:hypothetical protein